MNYPWMDDYFLAKPGTEKDFKPKWDATRYMLRGKMYGMVGGDKYGKSIVTLKLEPEFGEFLRGQYEDIVPGYYMNKEHWNSLYLEGSVPDDVLRDMIDRSYRLILAALPKKTQKEISG